MASNRYRTTSEEKRYADKLAMEDPETTYNDIRKAAEAHRIVRQHAQKWIKPGMAMIDIANMIEDGTRALAEENGFEAGVGFPTGLSLNHCAAHYTPNAGDKIGACGRCATHERDAANANEPLLIGHSSVLQKEDVLKVDIGIQVNGRICDSAFTLNFEPTYDRLIEAVKAATETGVRVRSLRATLTIFHANILIRKLELMYGWESLLGTSKRPWNPMRSKLAARSSLSNPSITSADIPSTNIKFTEESRCVWSRMRTKRRWKRANILRLRPSVRQVGAESSRV